MFEIRIQRLQPQFVDSNHSVEAGPLLHNNLFDETKARNRGRFGDVEKCFTDTTKCCINWERSLEYHV